MNTASAPRNLFWTPSSSSISSSARLSASSLIPAAGAGVRASSSLMRAPSVELDALLRVVLHRARMPGQRRSVGLLVLELEVLGFLVHAHQVFLVLEDRLDDVVR